jgi:hypothetical protein
VEHQLQEEQRQVIVRDTVRVVGVYVLTNDPDYRAKLATRHRDRMTYEQSLGFDPVNNSDDMRKLRSLVE